MATGVYDAITGNEAKTDELDVAKHSYRGGLIMGEKKAHSFRFTKTFMYNAFYNASYLNICFMQTIPLMNKIG